MTLPYEEEYTLKATRQFLLSLLDPKLTPGVPARIRKQACARVRHYPADYIISEIYEARNAEEKRNY